MRIKTHLGNSAVCYLLWPRSGACQNWAGCLIKSACSQHYPRGWQDYRRHPLSQSSSNSIMRSFSCAIKSSLRETESVKTLFSKVLGIRDQFYQVYKCVKLAENIPEMQIGTVKMPNIYWKLYQSLSDYFLDIFCCNIYIIHSPWINKKSYYTFSTYFEYLFSFSLI